MQPADPSPTSNENLPAQEEAAVPPPEVDAPADPRQADSVLANSATMSPQESLLLGRRFYLSEPWPSRCRGGHPALPLAECPSQLANRLATLPDGAAVPLWESNTHQFLGFGLIDRLNDQLRLWPAGILSTASDLDMDETLAAAAPGTTVPDSPVVESVEVAEAHPDPAAPKAEGWTEASDSANAAAEIEEAPVALQTPSTPATVALQPEDRFFMERVHAAWQWRRGLGFDTTTMAFRLIHGEGDGLPGFWVDIYANFGLIWIFNPAHLQWAQLLGEILYEKLELAGVIAKVRPSGEPTAGRLPFTLLAGEPPPRQLQVQEDGCVYETHLLGGLNTGLFCDMREVRRELQRWVPRRRVLNLFSYTGSLSVVSARAGAKEVTSVDFVQEVLLWSKTNFQLNQLSSSERRYKFVRKDVFEFLKERRRQAEQWDLIVVDPPTTTCVPGRRWFLRSDYERLLGHVLPVLAANGILVVCASSFESRPDKLEQQIRSAARDRQRRLRLVAQPGLPPDFPTQMIWPQGRYLKCFFLLADD